MSKWSAMAAQTKTAGGAVTPEPLQNAEAESWDGEAYPRGSSRYKVPLFDSVKATRVSGFIEADAPRAVLEKLAAVHEVRAKEEAAMFGIGVMRDNLEPGVSMAAGAAHKGVWAVVLDVDSATPEQIATLDAALGRKGWIYLKAPTYNWAPDAPRFRYVVPLSRITDGGQEYTQGVWAGLQALSGGIGDTGAKDATRRSYLPSCPVGTRHSRPPPTVMGNHPADPDEIAAAAQGASGPVASSRVYDLSVNADVLQQYDSAPADFELIRAECEAVRWAAEPDNQQKVTEPYWRAMLGIVKHCAGPDGLADEVSKHHPEYDPRNTARKMAAWGAGPTTCSEFGSHSAACAACPHRGKIKSPIVLGRAHQQASHEAPTTTGLTSAVVSGALRPIVDQDGVLNYVETYTKDGRTCRQVVRSGSGTANDLILTTAAAGGGKAPSQQAIVMFEAQLRTKAKRAGQVTSVALRVAQDGDARYVDLGPGRIVRIDPQGWAQVDESQDTPLFRRGAGAGELPDPEPFDGDARAALAHCMGYFEALFQTPTDQAVIRTAVALDRLDPETTHPVCEYVGPAGSGKSTAAEHDVGLIDPPSKHGLRTCGAKTEDIAAVAQQQYVLSMDNVSRFDKATADTLCMTSTGGTLTVRKLYEQTETAALHLLRPVAITAVSPVCTQPDLQNRTLRFDFRPNANREVLSEGEIRTMTEARLPALLGALYSLKAATLRTLPEVRQRKGWKHRLVTFDQTGEAMLSAAGYPPGGFLKIVDALREAMARRSASGDVFLLKVCAALKGVQSWPKDDSEPGLRHIMMRPRPAAVFNTTEGLGALIRPSVLLGLLPRPDPWDRDSPIPKTERALMDALRRVQPTLHAMGVLYREGAYGSRPVLRFDWRPSDLNDFGSTQ